MFYRCFAFVGLFADEMATTDNSSAVFTLHSGNWLSNAKSNTTFEIGNGGSIAISRSYKPLRINNRIINDIDKAPDMVAVAGGRPGVIYGVLDLEYQRECREQVGGLHNRRAEL